MTIRIVQWTTGGVGRPALRAVLAHPQLVTLLELPTVTAGSVTVGGKR